MIIFRFLILAISTQFSVSELTPFEKYEHSSYPNIVFIIADDLGWNSIGYRSYDMQGITPKLDELANGGIVINTYYSQELCTPARYKNYNSNSFI